MYEALVARVRYHIQKANFMGLKEAESTLLLAEAADAIEELQQIAGHYEENAHDYFKDVCYYLERMPKWIPVKERLPGEMDRSCGGWSAEIRPSDDVLVWLSSEKRQSVAWYSHTYNEWTTVDENTVYCFGEVTHWMPVPEPPKEGK